MREGDEPRTGSKLFSGTRRPWRCRLFSGTRRPWRCRLFSGTRRPWRCRLPAGPRPGLPTLLAAVVIGALFLLHLRRWAFWCDDAFISFRFAHNLGQHGELVYNLAPFERVEGYTNFLWVLILGLGDALGLLPERLAPILTATSSLAALLLVALIGAQLRRRFGPGQATSTHAFEPCDLLAPALLVTLPEFVVWGSSGLETSFALALGLLAVWLWLGGRIELAAVATAATGLTRPDGMLWIAAFGLGWLVVVGLERPRAAIPWRRVAVATIWFVLPLAAALAFRRVYYGEWLPNTWAVKQHGAALRDVYGVGYLEFWAVNLGLVTLAPLSMLLRPRHAMLLLPIVVQLAWAWSIGGDFMAYGRFLLPATTLLALLLGLVLAEFRVARAWTKTAWWVLAAVLILANAGRIPARLQADRADAHLHLDQHSPGFESVDAMHRFALVRLTAGRLLAERVPEDTLITVGAAGALPYASSLPAFDSYGLVDPGVVAVAKPQTQGARPGHQLYPPIEYMKSHGPDLMCHVGYAGEPLPPPGLDRRMRAGREWTGWACVETGPIADRRAEGGVIASHVYCCLRPRDRFTELDESLLRRPE
jgi:arabinofuranosyltransferase